MSDDKLCLKCSDLSEDHGYLSTIYLDRSKVFDDVEMCIAEPTKTKKQSLSSLILYHLSKQ